MCIISDFFFFYHACCIRYIFTSKLNLSLHQVGGIHHVESKLRRALEEITQRGCGFVSPDAWEQVRQTRKTVSKPDPALGNWGELHDLSRSPSDYFPLLQDQSYSRKGNLALWAFSYSGSSEFNTAIVYSVKHLSIKDGAMKEAVLWNTEMPVCSSSEGLLLRTQQYHQSSEVVPKEVGQYPHLLIPGWRGPCCNSGVTVPERSFFPLPPQTQQDLFPSC